MLFTLFVSGKTTGPNIKEIFKLSDFTVKTNFKTSEKAKQFIENNKAFNKRIGYYGDFETFLFRLIDTKENSIEGAINGRIIHNTMHIKQLIVGQKYRGKVKGLGTLLIKTALEYGKNKKLAFAHLETMEFQAPGFYKALGFDYEFQRKNLGKNEDQHFYYMRNDGCMFTYDLETKMENIRKNNLVVTKVEHEISKELDIYIKREFQKHSESKVIDQPVDIAPFCITLEQDGKLVGVATGKTFYGGLHIKELIVAQESEQELLLRLFGEVLSYASHTKRSLLFIDTWNKAAKDFYVKQGFTLGFTRDGYSNGAHYYYLTRYLKYKNSVF